MSTLFHRILARETPIAPTVYLDRQEWERVWKRAQGEEHSRRGRTAVPPGTGTVHIRFRDVMDSAVRIYLWPSWPTASAVRFRMRGSDLEGFDAVFGTVSPEGGTLEWIVRRLEEARKHGEGRAQH